METLGGTELFILLEVLILENVGRGANHTEAHAILAGLACGEGFTADHDHLMCGAVVAFVDDFVNSRLAHGIAGLEAAAITAAGTATRRGRRIVLPGEA